MTKRMGGAGRGPEGPLYPGNNYAQPGAEAPLYQGINWNVS